MGIRLSEEEVEQEQEEAMEEVAERAEAEDSSTVTIEVDLTFLSSHAAKPPAHVRSETTAGDLRLYHLVNGAMTCLTTIRL